MAKRAIAFASDKGFTAEPVLIHVVMGGGFAPGWVNVAVGRRDPVAEWIAFGVEDVPLVRIG